tara:strand:- start:310 stop:660 length:351 start_codon:yes stop_codon:yes gene_type:complete
MFKNISNTTKILIGASVIGVAYYVYTKNKKKPKVTIGSNPKLVVIEEIKTKLLDPNKKIHRDIREFAKSDKSLDRFNTLSIDELNYMNSELDKITFDMNKQISDKGMIIIKKLIKQ